MSGEVVHRLGVAVCVMTGILLLADAVSAWRHTRRTRRRCGAALGHPGGDATTPADGPGLARPAARSPGAADRGRAALRRWVPAVAAISAGYVWVGGAPGLLAGAVAGAVVWRWGQAPAPPEEFDAARALRELPLAAELLAACVTAGADPVTAARAVGETLGGPVGERLARGAAEVRLGGEPEDAWRPLARLPGAVGQGLARLLERAEVSGAPAAAPVARLAAEARAARGREATARAQRAGVLITAPVGLCFLPAFLAVGVLPVVIGLAGELLGGGGG